MPDNLCFAGRVWGPPSHTGAQQEIPKQLATALAGQQCDQDDCCSIKGARV